MRKGLWFHLGWLVGGVLLLLMYVLYGLKRLAEVSAEVLEWASDRLDGCCALWEGYAALREKRWREKLEQAEKEAAETAEREVPAGDKS